MRLTLEQDNTHVSAKHMKIAEWTCFDGRHRKMPAILRHAVAIVYTPHYLRWRRISSSMSVSWTRKILVRQHENSFRVRPVSCFNLLHHKDVEGRLLRFEVGSTIFVNGKTEIERWKWERLLWRKCDV